MGPVEFIVRILIILVVLIQAACTAIQPFPMAARAGDTIALSVGSPEDMSISNTTVSFTSDADGILVDLTTNVRAVFKLYPDKTSRAWDKSSGITLWSGHGAWLSLIAIDLPNTLQLGRGVINVSTSAWSPSNLANVNNYPITVEILPGTGAPNNFEYYSSIFDPLKTGNLSDLEPMRQAIVRLARPTSGTADTSLFAAAEVKINYPMFFTDGTPVADSDIKIVIDDMQTNLDSKLQTSWKRNGDDISVIFLSPEGKMRAHELRFSIVYKGDFFPAMGPGTLISATYWDINGNEVAGPGPELIEAPTPPVLFP